MCRQAPSNGGDTFLQAVLMVWMGFNTLSALVASSWGFAFFFAAICVFNGLEVFRYLVQKLAPKELDYVQTTRKQ